MVTLKRSQKSTNAGAKIAADEIETILGTLGPASKLPADFFDDHFVLGFIYLLARALAAVNMDNAARPESVEEVYRELFGEEGPFLHKRSVRFFNARAAAFGNGYRAADKLISAMSGSPRYANDPVVHKAMQSFDEWKKWPQGEEFVDAEQARYLYLFDALFGVVLRQRFPEMNVNPRRH
jgi:hypothetical protein